jgi:hypothetical protein
MSPFEISVAFQSDEADYAALGRIVDDYPFDAVSVYQDLFFPPSHGPLLTLAAHTKSARLGPAALNPYTLHPVEIARPPRSTPLRTGVPISDWSAEVGRCARYSSGLPDRACARRSRSRYLLAGRTDGYHGEIFALALGPRCTTSHCAAASRSCSNLGERTARARLARRRSQSRGIGQPAAARRSASGCLTLACVLARCLVDHDGNAAGVSAAGAVSACGWCLTAARPTSSTSLRRH